MWFPQEAEVRKRYGKRPGFNRAWDRALAWCRLKGHNNQVKFVGKLLQELDYESRRAKALGSKAEVLGEFLPDNMNLIYHPRVSGDQRLKISEVGDFKIVAIRKAGRVILKVRKSG